MSSNKNNGDHVNVRENDCISTAICCTYIFVYMYVNFILVCIHSVMLVPLAISLVRYLGVTEHYSLLKEFDSNRAKWQA